MMCLRINLPKDMEGVFIENYEALMNEIHKDEINGKNL